MAAFKYIVRLDWVIIFLYLALVSIGWVNIYSASWDPSIVDFVDFDQIYFKQLIWIGLSLILIVFILAIDSKFYERFSSIIYLAALVLLLGLFPFGKTINGATSWYNFGGLGLQPGEFAKAATALALGKYISDIQTNIRRFNHQLRAFLIIFLPSLFIVLQPDPGSALVFGAFLFPLFREGLHPFYLSLGFIAGFLFAVTLAFGLKWVSIGLLAVVIFIYALNRKKRGSFSKFATVAVIGLVFVFSVNYIFNQVFEQRHRDRFNIVLGKEVDTQGIGYNINQSQIAIGSGGLTGKGWLQGTQTKGRFVPEQHTDYIFSTVGEEWGFLGAFLVIILFVMLIIRIIIKAERQNSQFSRVYGYGVASVLFFHFLVNIGMVSGLLPTVGIPLPFLSYGGSGLWSFTILLFIFVRFDSQRHINR